MALELEALAGDRVLSGRSFDVAEARERARQKRLRRLALPLGLIAAYLWIRVAAGDPFLLGWPRVPASLVPFVPAAVLVVVLGAALLAPLLGAGRSPHVLYRAEDAGVRLSDVKGLPVVVEEVIRTLNLFLAHETFAKVMGGTPRRAALFEGPPGTGKTFVARAMAAEAGVPFLFVSSSAFQSMYYGQTNRKIRNYFRALRRAARAEGGAIGFIEEIDAVGATRSGMGGSSGREGVAGVVNELLVQLQSFDEPPRGLALRRALVDLVNRFLSPQARFARPKATPANVLVIGATNRASDLDPALLRPGRFDRSIHFDLPTRAGRRQIIDHYLARKAHAMELDDPARRDELAAMTLGYSPVMLEHLLDEGLVWALRSRRTRMSWADLMQARLTEELGLAQPVQYTEAERRRIATHEAGHATVAWLAGEGRRMEVLSIVKRSEALGLLAHSDTEERFTKTRSELLALIQIAMGGMVAEELHLGEASTGVAGDLTGATAAAVQMVGSLGMGESLASLEAVSGGADLAGRVLASDDRRRDVERILREAKERVRTLLERNRSVTEALRDALLQREELVGPEIVHVIAAAGSAALIDLTEKAALPGVAPTLAGELRPGPGTVGD
ncbi:MAG: AAA family ATPase [Acidimicrobiales bacterium]